MKCFCLVLAFFLFSIVILSDDYIWIEGESTKKHSFAKHNWYDSVKKNLLSGNDWLSHYAKNKTGKATYSFKVKEDGSYTFWLRANVLLTTMSYQIDKKPFDVIDLKSDVRDRIRLSKRPDHRDIGWIKVSTLPLKKGTHHITFLANSKLSNHGGIDCFCLINYPWIPSGVTKPSSKNTKQKALKNSWFQVIMDDDSFSNKSIIDMSSLIPKPAGQFGYLNRQGKDFVWSKTKKKIKFWGIGSKMLPTEKLQKQQAKFYTKNGINMIRVHTVQQYLGLLQSAGGGKRTLDEQKLKKFDKWFAVLKAEGLYVTFSFFYPHHITKDDAYPKKLRAELPKSRQGRSTSGLIHFMPQLQQAELDWLKVFLNHKNPYTGLKYIDDPALAVIEIRNEDSIFWHYPLNILVAGKKFPLHTKILQDKWLAWLKKKYKSNTQLKKSWGIGYRPEDSLANKKIKMYAAWEMQSDGPKLNSKEKKRMGDFIEFLARMQRAAYLQRASDYKKMGFKGIIVSTAWRAGGPAADAANLWCDDALDAIDRHNYFGGGVGGHGIKPGKVNNQSHLSQPGTGILASGLYQVEDKPFMMTEWTQLPPNQYKLEISSLFAFYGMGLQGWDASYHFSGSMSRMGSGWPNLNSYVSETPHFMGQFPAISFAIYQRHFKEGDIVAGRRLKVGDLFKGVDPLRQNFSGGGHDQKKIIGDAANLLRGLAMGRVTQKVYSKKEYVPSHFKPFKKYETRNKQVITSNTGELLWNTKNKFVHFNSKKTQGINGFVGGFKHTLKSVTVDHVKTKFGVLLLTPLDNKNLIDSDHILVTCMGQDKQTNAVYNVDGSQLLKMGESPLLIEPFQAEITLKGKKIKSVKTVDFYGVPTEQQLKVTKNTFHIDGTHQCYYYEIKR